MIEPRNHIGVAVSGGIDSVALLDILATLREELHIELIVLHLNHRIRGAESIRDQQFVQNLSERYDLPYHAKEVDVPGFIKETPLSLQDAARELRYRFFEEASQTLGLDKVAIGQTADDQAETVLMRFIRGGGTRGLKGIPSIRGPYIRPLIEVWRQDLLEYIQHKGLAFVQDSSNLKKDYLRNRVRYELLPALKEYNPSIKQRLLRLAQIMGQDESYLEGLADEVTKGIVAKDEAGFISISIPSLLPLPSALQARVLQRAFAMLSGGILEYPHVKGIIALIQEDGGSKRTALPEGYWAIRTYDQLIMEREGAPASGMVGVIELLIPGTTRLNGIGREIEATLFKGKPDLQADPQVAYLDLHQLAFPLRCRTFHPGDNFIPLGMNKPKKLKNFFIDLKIPQAERLKIPLVMSGTDICWVGGLRIGERFKIKEVTKKILRLALKRL
jgi:tRNA(Ile)-lysidine synthase